MADNEAEQVAETAPTAYVYDPARENRVSAMHMAIQLVAGTAAYYDAGTAVDAIAVGYAKTFEAYLNGK